MTIGYVYATVATDTHGKTRMQIYSTTDSEALSPLHKQLALLGANVGRRTLASIKSNPGENREVFTRRLKALESLYVESLRNSAGEINQRGRTEQVTLIRQDNERSSARRTSHYN